MQKCPTYIIVAIQLFLGRHGNSDRKFFNCAVGKDNGGCSFFKWLDEDSWMSSPSTSNFGGAFKFHILQRLRKFKEKRDLLMTLLKEAEEQRDYLKESLKEVE
ncbi:hypothetical protein BC332_30230 [Capsicum chinense]|nr:hypothetical protein BC332_30230 [Capsicum chinense]